MNKNFFFSIFIGLLAATLIFGLSLSVTAEEPKYGGTLRMCNIGRSLNALTFNHTDWVWKHGYDTGMTVEHLFMGDLQKGPRGSNEYAFSPCEGVRPSPNHISNGSKYLANCFLSLPLFAFLYTQTR